MTNIQHASEEKPIEHSADERALMKLLMVWFLMIPLALFWITQFRPVEVMQLSVIPVAPKAGDPVVATSHLNNPNSDATQMSYAFYKDGQLLAAGTSEVQGNSTKTFQYAQKQPYGLGDRSAFTMQVTDGSNTRSAQRAVPEYPAMVLSSFVSFAVSSTTLMSSIVSMSYYRAEFATKEVFDIGVILVMALLGLAVFKETAFAQPLRSTRAFALIDTLSHRFQPILIALAIIFGGIGITRMMLLLGVIS